VRRRCGRPEQIRVTLRCAAQPTDRTAARVQADAEATRGRERKSLAVRGGGKAGALCTPPPTHPGPNGLAPLSPRAPCADGCASGARRRRSPIQRGGRQPPHAIFAVERTPAPRALSCIVASAGRSVERIARELLLPSADRLVLVHVVLCRAQRRGTGNRQCSASFAFLPTQPTVGFGVAGRAATSGEGRGAFPRGARRSARRCQCLHRNMSILGQVLIARTSALVVFRSNPISADAPQTPRHIWGEGPFFAVGTRYF
jgi:hypothetical protein